MLNGLVDACIAALRFEDADETVKSHNAAVTLAVVSRAVLSKNLAGWEVMEVFAGGVSDSDRVFKVNIEMYVVRRVQRLTSSTGPDGCDRRHTRRHLRPR